MSSRTAVVTTNALTKCKEMIINTTSNLRQHLREVDQKLNILSSQGSAVSKLEDNERGRMQEEKDSTEQCLRICAWVSQHIHQVETNNFEDISTDSDKHRVLVSSHEKSTRATDVKEQHRMRREREGIQQYLSIYAEASEQANSANINFFEDVSAAQDAQQVTVATLGDLISARRVTAAARSTQWLGQMSDATVQQLSRDRNHVAVPRAPESGSAFVKKFEDRHGAGKRL